MSDKYYVAVMSEFHNGQPTRTVTVSLEPKMVSTAQYGLYVGEFSGWIEQPTTLIKHYYWSAKEPFVFEYQGVKLKEGQYYVDPEIRKAEQAVEDKCNKVWATFITDGKNLTVEFVRQESQPNIKGTVTLPCKVHGDMTKFVRKIVVLPCAERDQKFQVGESHGPHCIVDTPRLNKLYWRISVETFLGIRSRYISVMSASSGPGGTWFEVLDSHHFATSQPYILVYRRQVMNDGAGKIEFKYQGKGYAFQIPELDPLPKSGG